MIHDSMKFVYMHEVNCSIDFSIRIIVYLCYDYEWKGYPARLNIRYLAGYLDSIFGIWPVFDLLRLPADPIIGIWPITKAGYPLDTIFGQSLHFILFILRVSRTAASRTRARCGPVSCRGRPSVSTPAWSALSTIPGLLTSSAQDSSTSKERHSLWYPKP